jgi:hypothetical protein
MGMVARLLNLVAVALLLGDLFTNQGWMSWVAIGFLLIAICINPMPRSFYERPR